MMPKKRDRIALAAISVLALLMLLFAGMCTLVPSFAYLAGQVYSAVLSGNIVLRIVLTLLVLVLMELVCYKTWTLLFARPERSLETLALQDGDGGEVRVSLQALEAMARRAVGEAEGVREAAVAIEGSQEALRVKIDLKVTTAARIPEVTGRMQCAVRDAVANFTGVSVSEVAVLVSDIVPEAEASFPEKPDKG